MKNENDFVKLTAAKLEVTRTLPAKPERVWEYLVDPDLRKLWFCAGETGDQPGGDFVMDFDHTRISDSAPPEGVECGSGPVTMKGTIVTFDPPKVLAYSWPEENGPGTLVTIRLEPKGDDTHLHLVHERLHNAEFLKGASAGWHAHLDLLVDLVSDRPRRDFWIHYAALKSEYDQRV